MEWLLLEAGVEWRSAVMEQIGTGLPNLRSERRVDKRNEFITIRVSETLKAQLETIADQEDRTLSWLVNNMLEQSVQPERSGRVSR